MTGGVFKIVLPDKIGISDIIDCCSCELLIDTTPVESLVLEPTVMSVLKRELNSVVFAIQILLIAIHITSKRSEVESLFFILCVFKIFCFIKKFCSIICSTILNNIPTCKQSAVFWEFVDNS